MSVFYDLNKTPRNILNQAIVRAIVSESNGALFDPSDLSTLYQDSAGTTPVTAVEQPVGLMLDKARGVMLGPERVSNGDFSNGLTGWSVYALSPNTTTVENGELKILCTDGVNTYVKQDLTYSFYKVTGTLRVVSGTAGIEYATAAQLNYTVGTYAINVILRADRITLKRVTSCEAYFDNISVKELYGYHATQSITASRPTLSARKNVLLATEALATQSVTTLAATYTLSFTGTGSVTLSGAATGTLTGNGTDRVSLTFTPTSGTLTLTVSGSVTKAQIELGAVAGPYQRVNTATDYDTDERYFKKYLMFDGVDDYLNLPYMGLYAAGSASVVVAMSSFAIGGTADIIAERNTKNTAPTYTLIGKASASIRTGVYIKDNSNSVVLNTIGSSVGDITSPATIKTITDNGSVVKKYVNAILADADTYARSGTLTLNTTTIAASNTTTPTSFLLGNVYSLIITKSALTDSQRVACERYLVRKSGVQL